MTPTHGPISWLVIRALVLAPGLKIHLALFGNGTPARLPTLLALDWRPHPPKRANLRPIFYPLRWLVAHPPPASKANR